MSRVVHTLSLSLSFDEILAVVCSTPGSFLLDSADSGHPRARYSFAGVAPTETISGGENPWPFLDGMKRDAPESPYPFVGGWVGYLSYEAAKYLKPFSPSSFSPEKPPIPLFHFSFYPCVVVYDHAKDEALLVSAFLDEEELEEHGDWWECPPSPLTPLPLGEGNQGRLDLVWENYAEKIDIIQRYLQAGDAYQINLTQRFELKSERSLEELYTALRRISPAPFGALLNEEDFQILSASPELLMEADGRRVITAPIKGTRPRGISSQEDLREKQGLLTGEKEKAELLMIVDLERNDLGKICEPGSVEVTSLFNVESFSNVHHLVAQVSGNLKPGQTAVDALSALFPGGSVTGAPKKRAMEIIGELEEAPRSVYTGALGYFSADGKAQFNIPIRTLTKVGSVVYAHSGGGITVDSEARAERDELVAKIKNIISVI